MKSTRDTGRSPTIPPVCAAFGQLVDIRVTAWNQLKNALATTQAPTGETDPFWVDRMLAKFDSQIAQLTTQNPTEIHALRDWVKAEKAKVALAFESDLQAFCAGQLIKYEGRYPSYIIADYISVELNPSKERCVVDEERIESLMFQSIVPLIAAAVEQLRTATADPEIFTQQLYLAYLRARSGEQMGEELIPAKQVYREMVFLNQESSFQRNPIKANFREYTLRAFSRDLAVALSAGSRRAANGMFLSIGPTSTADGIPIRVEGAIRHIGRIGFVSTAL